MESICLFEAGGTKTTLLVSAGNEMKRHDLPGFNPNRYAEDFEKSLARLALPQGAQIVFYGSGLGSEFNKEIVRQVLQRLQPKAMQVFDDQLGAARAAFGDREGLVAIMGTGAFVAWYNGQSIEDAHGGHGYLIDDLGGGFELGKVVLSAWLNGDLPSEVDHQVHNQIQISKADFTTIFYQKPDLAMVAGIAPVLIPYLHLPVVLQLVRSYFDLFFSRHVRPVLVKHPTTEIALIGGIARGFESVIALSASDSGIKTVQVIQDPAENLLAYHRRKGFKS